MSLSRTLYPLLISGSAEEAPSYDHWKIIDLDVKSKQANHINIGCIRSRNFKRHCLGQMWVGV